MKIPVLLTSSVFSPPPSFVKQDRPGTFHERNKGTWLVIVLSFLILGALLQGEDRSQMWVAIQAGGGLPLVPSDFQKDHSGATLLGLRIGYNPSYRWAVGAEFASYSIGSKTTPPQDVRLQPVTGFFEWDWPWTWYLTPYAIGNLGISRNKKDVNNRSETNTGWTVGAGLGLRFRFSEFGDLAVETGLRHFTHATQDNDSLLTANASVLFQIYLPESWVPRSPPEDFGLADLEIPIVRPDDVPEIDESLILQGKILRLQQQIDAGDMEPMAFEPGGTILLTTAFNALDNLGAILRGHPDVRVKIYGYVDAGYTGSAGPALSLARAEVVKNYLVQNFRLLESRLFTESEPSLTAPDSPSSKQAHRLEFKCLPVNQ